MPSKLPIVFIWYSTRSSVAVSALQIALRKRQVQVYARVFELDENGQKFKDLLTQHPPKSAVLLFAFGSQVLRQPKFSETFRSVSRQSKRSWREIISLRLESQPPSIPEERDAVAGFDLSGSSSEYLEEFDRLLEHLGAIGEEDARNSVGEYSHVSGVIEATIPQSSLFAELQRQIKEGAIDQKYLYWDVRAAVRWQEIAESSTYMTAQTSMNILAAHAPEILRDFRRTSDTINYTFINFGVGTGMKDFLILSELLRNNEQAKVLYMPVDESLPMMHITILQMQELMGAYGDRLRIHFVLDDFQNTARFRLHVAKEEAAWFGEEPVTRLVGLLGGSIGNFRERQILGDIKSLLKKPSDRLVLGAEYIGGRSRSELSENYEDRRMKEFLYGPIADVEASQPNWDEDFRNEVVATESDVNDARTIIGYVKHDGRQIRLFQATKYNRGEFEVFLREQGFDIVSSYTTDEVVPRFGKYVLSLRGLSK